MSINTFLVCVNSHKNHSSITLTEDQQRDSIYKLINFNQQQGRPQQQRIWRQRQGVPFLLTPDTQYEKIKKKYFFWLIISITLWMLRVVFCSGLVGGKFSLFKAFITLISCNISYYVHKQPAQHHKYTFSLSDYLRFFSLYKNWFFSHGIFYSLVPQRKDCAPSIGKVLSIHNKASQGLT